MKKILALLCAVALCVLLCACDPGTYIIDREALNQVISVELIAYENAHQKHFTSWAPNHFDELLPFDTSNVTVLETLPAEKIPDFLDAFSQTEILHKYYAYNSPKDVCLRLSYENGNFLIVWANYADGRFAGYIGEYQPDGSVLTFWGSFSNLRSYEDLVSSFFEYCLS